MKIVGNQGFFYLKIINELIKNLRNFVGFETFNNNNNKETTMQNDKQKNFTMTKCRLAYDPSNDIFLDEEEKKSTYQILDKQRCGWLENRFSSIVSKRARTICRYGRNI